MEISDNTIGIFYLSKVFALAPYAVRMNSKGLLEIRRSLAFTVYSVALSSIMVFLTYNGLLFDANSKNPVRMKSATSKVVTAMDVSVVVLAATAGVFCGVTGLKATRELNMRLRKIDSSLHSFSNYKRDHLRTIFLTVLPLTANTILLGLDIWSWMRVAHNIKIDKEDTELNVKWYIPFYSLYFILTPLQILLANTAIGLGRRYSRLNLMLKSLFLTDTKNESAPTKQKITTVKTKLTDEHLYDAAAKNKGILMKLLAENHESLAKCVALVSSSYGIAMLFILVSCLLHLVATAYFIFLEILSNDNGTLWLQILWMVYHTFRLLLFVEPCHLTTFESKRTIHIVCEIERKVQDPILTEEIKKFWQQLLVLDSKFSACGLCRVNRKILTSFSGAICTYLVIFIQFQNSNG